MEKGKPDNPERKPRSVDENRRQTQLTKLIPFKVVFRFKGRHTQGDESLRLIPAASSGASPIVSASYFFFLACDLSLKILYGELFVVPETLRMICSQNSLGVHVGGSSLGSGTGDVHTEEAAGSVTITKILIEFYENKIENREKESENWIV